MTAMFFAFDGPDGSGKTTQIELAAEWLRASGHEVATCRDPGSTRLGEAVRRLLLDDHEVPIARTSEMLLYMAARAQLVDEVIRPALAAGRHVISDRFLLANIVYQGYAGGVDIEAIRTTGAAATGGLRPDLTIVLDVDDDTAARRMTRALDRMERQGETFRRAVRQGFLTEAATRPGEIVVVDASRAVGEVQQDVQVALRRVLDAARK
jgi:dTMP kinase